MVRVRFVDVVAASAEVAATRSRRAKVTRIAAALRAADPTEVPAVVAWLSGELRQRRTGVGWASLRNLPAPAAAATLTVPEVDAAITAIAAGAGAGSAGRRRQLVGELMARATDTEQRLLRGLFTGEVRQGALEGIVVDAVAAAAQLPVSEVRQAVMLRGAVGPVAQAVLGEGPAALARFRLQVGRPVQPMLAQPAPSVAAALTRLGEAGLEYKLDGVRVQLHRSGRDVAVFTRTLDDITSRVPELVAATLALPATAIVLDGEAIALRPDGRPRPFQETAARMASRAGFELSLFGFDVLHLDGDDLLAQPARDRLSHLPAHLAVPRTVTDDPAAGAAFLDQALAAGHEGIVAKSLDGPYEAGRRGGAWLKVKPVHTLDLVVLAAEWGHGRRRGWLSNLHLGARDPAGGFVMLGKTFKGLTDELLRWQTGELLARATDRGDWVVTVRPELVVEVAFDGVQTSPRYPGGVALRFARVIRYRPDKSVAEADTIDAVRSIRAQDVPFER
jgi:DNA ligase-1